MKHYERYIGGSSIGTSRTCLHVMRRLWVLMKFSIALAGIKTAAAICGDGGGLTTPPLALIRPAKERKLTEHILEGTILPRNAQYFHTGGAKQLVKFSMKCNIRWEKSFCTEFHHACYRNRLLMQRKDYAVICSYKWCFGFTSVKLSKRPPVVSKMQSTSGQSSRSLPHCLLLLRMGKMGERKRCMCFDLNAFQNWKIQAVSWHTEIHTPHRTYSHCKSAAVWALFPRDDI